MTGSVENNPVPFALRFYSGTTAALTPLAHLLKPGLSTYGGFKDTVSERLGKFSPVLDELEANRGDRKVVFIHAVSVGEAAIANPLVSAIRSRKPDCLIAISTTTFTGRDYILKNFKPDALFFFPIDLPGVMRRLVDKLRPDCFLDIEIELWPNLFRALVEAGVPMALANGRISDRSANPPSIVRSVYRWMLGSLDALFMRSAEDVERVIGLGAPEDRTHLAGNLKFAACGEPPEIEERDRVRCMLGVTDENKLIVAGSTHPGEDEKLIEAWQKINADESKPDSHLVIAPRHLEQVERIAKLFKQDGVKVELWTDIQAEGRIQDGVRAVIVNTIGELMAFYGAADVAFVGGSLVTRGGHNVLEPVAMGVPTLHGPSMANFHDLKQVLGKAGLIYEVADADELAEKSLKIFDEINLSEYRIKARSLISQQLQATDMIADWVAGKIN